MKWIIFDILCIISFLSPSNCYQCNLYIFENSNFGGFAYSGLDVGQHEGGTAFAGDWASSARLYSTGYTCTANFYYDNGCTNYYTSLTAQPETYNEIAHFTSQDTISSVCISAVATPPPTPAPTYFPTPNPTPAPTLNPASAPTYFPTPAPTLNPTS
eukprot:241494_1